MGREEESYIVGRKCGVKRDMIAEDDVGGDV